MGLGIRSFCLLVFLLSGCISCCSAVDGKKKVASAMVVGTVICNTCFAQEFAKSGQLITGASVAVECGDPMTKSSFRKVARTNRRGVFRVRLPPAVGMNIERIESCSVRLIKSSQPFCTVASSATSSKLRLKSRRNGIHVYSAGFFTFKPLKEPDLCNQKTKSKIQPAFFFFPPSIPFLPAPSIGGVPLPPNPLQPPLLPPNPLLPSPPSLLPPNPLLPSPPSLLPPNPLLPSPPSLLPPNPFQPAPAPFFGLPPLPFVTPSPPPPAFLLPPLPFLPPNPLFPGIPPASDSKKSTSP